MTTIEVHDPDAFPEKNQGRFLFIEMCANEYQFELQTKADVVLVGFYKGDWTIKVNDYPVIKVSDGGFAYEEGNPLHEGFIKARMEAYKGDDLTRRGSAQALWEYAVQLAPRLLKASLKFYVHQPWRNGMATENGVEVCRKDW